jgi:hypothetical protein
MGTDADIPLLNSKNNKFDEIDAETLERMPYDPTKEIQTTSKNTTFNTNFEKNLNVSFQY